MFTFFLNICFLFVTLVHGIRKDPEFKAMGIMLLIMLLGGALFYSGFEGWSLIDSLYFCVMTIATIGYGDFSPSDDISKLFTIVYAIFGIGLFASFVAKLVALRLELHAMKKEKHHWFHKSERSKSRSEDSNV